MAESKGTLVVTVKDADCGKVLEGATVILKCSRGGCTGVSNSDGRVTFSVPTPSVVHSYTPHPRERPYEAVDLRIVLAGYITVAIIGEQIFPGEITRQTVMMGTLDQPSSDGKPMALERVIVIPEHHLYTAGSVPRVENMPEANAATSGRTGAAEAVTGAELPETIRVHLGPPDADAETVTVPFGEYVKNVAGSELYPTWPEQALRDKIEAFSSLARERLRGRWYPSRGYDFDITDSPMYDQRYVHEGGLFDRICTAVDSHLSGNGKNLRRRNES